LSLFAELKRRNVVRVVLAYLAGAWLLIQIGDTVFPAYGAPDSALTVLITLLVIGLIPVVVISWVFELTPEGLKRDAQVAPGESTTPRIARRLDRIIMIALTLAIGFFAIDKFVIDPTRDAALREEAEERGRVEATLGVYGDKSIAVLPFADLSPGGDQAYFSDGIAEELLNLLAKIRELRVISRSSAFAYRGEGINIPTVAKELNVAYVLEGSVRTAGDRVRITAQLIEAATDTHVWSEVYERQLVDIFAIQDEIAAIVADALELEILGPNLHVRRTDPETYRLYLEAHYLANVLGADMAAAEALLMQALERDPQYVPAWVLLAYVNYSLTGTGEVHKYGPEEGALMNDGYLRRALAIDPDDAAANVYAAWRDYVFRDDLESAVERFSIALRNEPQNVEVFRVVGGFMRIIGQFEEAIRFAELAIDRDPMCGACIYNLMNANVLAGNYDAAEAASRRRLEFARGGQISLGRILLLKGDPHGALAEFDKRKDDRVLWLGVTALAYHTLGRKEAFQEAVRELESIDDPRAFRELATAHAWAGNIDVAFAWLGRYVSPEVLKNKRTMSGIIWDPFLASLRDDPRWTELRKNSGLSSERLAAIRLDIPAT
jgi:TolB-like protein